MCPPSLDGMTSWLFPAIAAKTWVVRSEVDSIQPTTVPAMCVANQRGISKGDWMPLDMSMPSRRFKGVTGMPLEFAVLRPWMVTLVRRLGLSVFVAMVFIAAWDRPVVAQQASTAAATAGGKSRVVATVNADPITEKVLADETMRRYGSDIVDAMVNRYLILQACQQRGIEITKQEVSDEIARQAAKFRLDMGGLLQLLQEERNVSAAEYSNDVVWPMLALRRLVADKIEVTEEEFNKQYLARYGEAVKCRMIVTKDRQKAEQVLAQAKSDPAKFAELAKSFSEDEISASVGGLIPPIRRYTGQPDFETAVFDLQDGGVTDILQVGDEWMILQAVRRIPAATPAPQAIPAIREQIADEIRDEKIRVAAAGLFEQLQSEANVKKVFGDPAAEKQHPGVAALVNNQPLTIAQVAEEAVRRHGEEVLQGEINRRLLTQALRSNGVTVAAADLTAETERAAIAFGFTKPDGSADIQSWLQSVVSDGDTTEDIYVRDAVWPSVALRKLVESEVQLTDEELKRGFDSAYGPKVEVLAIVLGDQRTAQKVWQMARDNPTPQFFGELAQQYSIEPSSASNAGLVPPIRKHGGQPAIEKEAFSLKPGQLSGIVATGDKYIIMRCQGFTKPVVSDFDAVREELVRDLSEKKLAQAMASKFDELKENASIENFFAVAKKAAATTRR
ncbi:putative parvulin-type peptidyl-prolyl cis-trans isomerase precursor [Crateriforma conspicua]|uniref:peptidylprolyl isomerase n=2 Tax=Crateriforma conspicua TaxID=2527996 RepID=A0A5C5Y1X7_9PLAN|nr:putative parvulin-type peptidyl-prolyl cis-trans isomerase precursor [Crateriforma conspicua]